MNDEPYTNRFVDVHSKIKAMKDRAREESDHDAQVRESRLVREFTEIRDEEPE